MLDFLAQMDPKTVWNGAYGSAELRNGLIIGAVLSVVLFFGLLYAPSRLRRPIVSAFVFISGLFYVLLYLWPSPIARGPIDAPRNAVERVSFWLADGVPVVANISNVLAAFLLCLGVGSLLRIHTLKVMKQQKDWVYSVVLLGCLFAMAVLGLWDWGMREDPKTSILLADIANWSWVNKGQDLLFDGLLQQMDAAMFSLIAFYILSAAYRAFRMRSVEASILLLTAFVVLLSVMGAVQFQVDQFVAQSLAHNDPNSFMMNFQLSEIAGWLKNTVQSSSIRGIEFGVGIGLMAMGLRIWLSLERTGEAQ